MRGQLSIQFNWIFVLLVGAVIIGFFIMIIGNQQKQADVEVANDLVINLNTILSSLTNEPNTIEEFNIRNAEIRFICEPSSPGSGRFSEYFIKGSQSIRTTYDIIATPSRLQGDRIVTWTSLWSVPYDTAIFTFMASERTLFVFVNDSNQPSNEYLVSLHRQLPDLYTSRAITANQLGDFEPTGFDRYVFITSYPGSETLRIALNDIFAEPENSYVRGVRSFGDYGELRFRDPGQSNERRYFLDEALWAAIFSQDAASFDCTMEKANDKLEIITKILLNRAGRIKDEIASSFSCYDLFSEMETQLGTMLNTDNIQNMANIKEEMEQTFTDAQRDFSCPYLY